MRVFWEDVPDDTPVRLYPSGTEGREDWVMKMEIVHPTEGPFTLTHLGSNVATKEQIEDGIDMYDPSWGSFKFAVNAGNWRNLEAA